MPPKYSEITNSLEAKNHLLDQLNTSIDWYTKNSPSRGFWARNIRLSMIIFGGISVAIPVLSNMPLPLEITISPLLASIFSIITATLFAIEKYYGHANAWMRFESARQELETLRDQLIISWARLSDPHHPLFDSEKMYTELLRTSLAKHHIIKKETEKWTKSFDKAIKSTEPVPIK